jgi:hypothetical protein
MHKKNVITKVSKEMKKSGKKLQKISKRTKMDLEDTFEMSNKVLSKSIGSVKPFG